MRNPVRKRRVDWKKEGYKSEKSFLKKVFSRVFASPFVYVKKKIGKKWAKFATDRGQEIFDEFNKNKKEMDQYDFIHGAHAVAKRYIPNELKKLSQQHNLNLSAEFVQAIVDATAEEAIRAMNRHVYRKKRR